MAVKFYNPGARLFERLRFDHPTNDPVNQNNVSYFQIDVPEASFFEVPTEVTVETIGGGEQAVAVRFAQRIQADFRDIGVVLIDHKRDLKKKPIGEDENVALNEKDAKEKGDRLWKDAMLRLVREHEKICYEARANGFKPQRGRGSVAHALKTLGIEDPANDVADVLQRKQDVSELESVKAQLAEMQKMMLNLAAKGK